MPPRFYADFPSSSPYTTSVGATMIAGDAGGQDHPHRTQGAAQGAAQRRRIETACSTDVAGCAFTTGGGFSSIFPRPAWQTIAVEGYLNRSAALNASTRGLFDAGGRGYNDLTAVGNNIPMVISGEMHLCGVGGGTSASGPIVGGLLALINAERLEGGKPPLGLANPLLYSLAGCDNGDNGDNGDGKDVVVVVVGVGGKGGGVGGDDGDGVDGGGVFNVVGVDGGGNSNRCTSEPGYSCCPHGFPEAAHWDPLSGLGSLNWTALAAVAGGIGETGETEGTGWTKEGGGTGGRSVAADAEEEEPSPLPFAPRSALEHAVENADSQRLNMNGGSTVHTCTITEHGAVGDNKTMNTAAIQATIDGCHASSPGGSMVVVPSGAFKTGSLALRSNMEFHLTKGARLYGSTDPSDYPVVAGLPFGKMWRALISGYNLSNVKVTGENEAVPGSDSIIDGLGMLLHISVYVQSMFSCEDFPTLTFYSYS